MSEEITPRLGRSSCSYVLDGTDTDGTEWWKCTTHDDLAPSCDAPCSKSEDDHVLRAASDLVPGNMVDLEGDPVANIGADAMDRASFDAEYGVVDEISKEGENILVIFANLAVAVCFPANHSVKVATASLTPSEEYFADFFRGYLTCLLWCTIDMATGEDFDSEITPDDIEPELRDALAWQALSFVSDNRVDLYEYGRKIEISGEWTVAEQAGHDLALTRQHHGAGFWDRGVGQVGDRLSEAAHKLGDPNIESTPDGKVRGDA